MQVAQKIKIELSYDPAILCLGIYPEKVTIQKDTCTPVFTAALFTMAKTWKQSNRPTKEWIKMWYMYTVEYYSSLKNKIMPFAATWMDLEITILSEVRQRQILYNITYMWNLKRWYQWAYLQNRNRLMDFKNKLMVTKKERRGRRLNWGLGFDMYTYCIWNEWSMGTCHIAQGTLLSIVW